MESHGRQPRKWSLTEDQKLREEVEAQLVGGEAKDWCKIAESLPGRTNKDCRKRWHNSVAGGLKKGQWSKSEDQLLSRAVEEDGQKWTVVASRVGSRSADQCAKRWQQSLDPDLDRSEWRDSDDTALIEAVQRLGRHWKDIQREALPGRSKNDIKNRYTVLVRRYQHQGIALPNSNAPSSPSDCGTPAASVSFHDDEQYISPNPRMYEDLLPIPSHTGNRHSWSSYDNDAYSTWSTPQGYGMPTAIAGSSAPQPSAAINIHQYAYTQPPLLDSTVPTGWGQEMPYVHHTSPLLHAGTSATPSVYGYSNYAITQPPLVTHNSAYTASTGRAPYATTPNRSDPSLPGQQVYDANAAKMYRDPSHQEYPYYQS
ncbi:hypothetical protein BDW02DRAFT_493725 [Decorospora gaudefroyi]|uniref:Uncharacterized protein n=1 Tax=Decorospora gaudefroyi TaxID=184978 RepID=A0A6A5KPW0_9PLEO|nr:hypothetical protein BDW02DRAFT_493725 [Decorospora gaudefroyi]